MKNKLRSLFLYSAAAGVSMAATAPANIIPVPAPIGIQTTTTTVLFSQPGSDLQKAPGTNNLVQRGVYVPGSSTPLVPLQPTGDLENYFVVGSGLGGFSTSTLYIYAKIGFSGAPATPQIVTAPVSGGAPSPFITNLPVAQTDSTHASVAFDTTGTFGFNLIVTGDLGVQGYNSSGAPTFFYPNPSPGTFRLESATVAPLTFASCPGCLFFTAENVTFGQPGAIFVVPSGAPSGTLPQFWATGPSAPEGIVFVPASPCTVNGFAYFLSGFTPHVVGLPDISTGGALLEYTAAQLAPYTGQLLVPDEVTGNIYAYTGPNAPGGAPNSTIFSNTGYMLEGSTLAACPVRTSTTGFMTGGGQMTSFDASHGFNLGCSTTSNHNNLEVNWAGGNHFHLDTITSVTCFMDPSVGSPNPPAAGFNTMILTGTGKYNNQTGATISLIFTDAGEPGIGDSAKMTITFGGSTVLSVPFAKLATGNQQAH